MPTYMKYSVVNIILSVYILQNHYFHHTHYSHLTCYVYYLYCVNNIYYFYYVHLAQCVVNIYYVQYRTTILIIIINFLCLICSLCVYFLLRDCIY